MEDKGEGRWRKRSNNEVMSMFGLASMQTEIRIARLKWMQAMIEKPNNHHLMLTAMFGRFRFEAK